MTVCGLLLHTTHAAWSDATFYYSQHGLMRLKVNYFVHHCSRPSVAAYGHYLHGRPSHYHFHYQQQQQQQPSRDASHCLAVLFFSRFATQCYFNRPAVTDYVYNVFFFRYNDYVHMAVTTGKSSPAPGCAAYCYMRRPKRGLIWPIATRSVI